MTMGRKVSYACWMCSCALKWSFEMSRSPHLFNSPYSVFGQSSDTLQRVDAPVENCVLTLDIQMRLVADWEDAYWKNQFVKEIYYAAGRSYDQYRPAYELGWNAAMAHPDAQFDDVVDELERDWEGCKATSLLPWREVRDAVKEAWVHAALQMHRLQQQVPPQLHSPQIAQAVLPLYRACVLLADDLRRMSSVAMGDFAQQVLGRHMRLLRKMALQLKRLVVNSGVKSDPLQPWRQRLHNHWRRLKLRLSEWDAAQVFEVCELREQSLLVAYQAALRKPLPSEVKDLLSQHVKILNSNMEKLSWVRHNWVL